MEAITIIAITIAMAMYDHHLHHRYHYPHQRYILIKGIMPSSIYTSTSVIKSVIISSTAQQQAFWYFCHNHYIIDHQSFLIISIVSTIGHVHHLDENGIYTGGTIATIIVTVTIIIIHSMAWTRNHHHLHYLDTFIT